MTTTISQTAPTFEQAVERYQKWLDSMTGITIPDPPEQELSYSQHEDFRLYNQHGLLAIAHPTGSLTAYPWQHRSDKSYRVIVEATVKYEVEVDAGSDEEARAKARGWWPEGDGYCQPGDFDKEKACLFYQDDEMYWQIHDISDFSTLDVVEFEDDEEAVILEEDAT